MPNWCNNNLTIKGDEKAIKKFAKKINKQKFLNSFLPLPKELEGTTSPTRIMIIFCFGISLVNAIIKYHLK